MKMPQLGRFLKDCIVHHETAEGLTTDEMYGLYVSWCTLEDQLPVGDRAFRAALAAQDIHPHRNGHLSLYPGLSMTGPAATDYILSSVPDSADEVPAPE